MARYQRNSGGGRFIILIAIAAAGYYYYNSNHTKRVAPPPPTAAHEAVKSYALNAARDNWPPIAQGEHSSLPIAEAGTVNYYVVLDGSGSMNESECGGGSRKIKAAVAALEQFFQQLPKTANVGLAVFDGAGLSERVPLARDNRNDISAALRRVKANGGTPLRSAIALGYGKLLQQGERQLGYGDYHLVVVTDGKPEPETENPASEVQSLLADTPVVLHTIGFCIGTDHVLNQPGRSYYVAANSPEQLQQGLGDVLAEAPKFDASHFDR